jgi:ArsR family transcriptional regulator, virulence genes transcriptional regulator
MNNQLPIANPNELEARADEAARLLGALANAKRLIVLCNLVEGEMAVGELARHAGLGQAALSQHLARLRDMQLVETRRAGQSILYRLASAEVRAVLETLHRIYCSPRNEA